MAASPSAVAHRERVTTHVRGHRDRAARQLLDEALGGVERHAGVYVLAVRGGCCCEGIEEVGEGVGTARRNAVADSCWREMSDRERDSASGAGDGPLSGSHCRQVMKGDEGEVPGPI